MTRMCRRPDRRHLGLSRAGIARFAADRSGNVAVVFSLIAVVLMLAVGAAIDIGRWLHARDQTLAAIDAAVLAGARYLQTNSDDMDGALAAAQKYYAKNVESRLPVTDDTITFKVGDDGQSMTASGTAHISTPFLQFATIDKMALINESTAEFSKAGRKIGENLEISVMLDVTGSMAGSKLDDLKDAATDLVDIIVKAGDKDVSTKIALVPFSEDVRLPKTSSLNKARGNNLDDSKTVTTYFGFFPITTTYYLSDCIVERTGSQKYTDAEPKSGQYVMAHYTSTYTQSGHHGKKTGKCTIPENSAIQPLTDDADELKAKINDLTAQGGTAGHIGTAWAWYTLSPNWNSLWSSKNRAVDYDTANYQKIAILMTDGEYNTQYDSKGVSASTYQAANGSSTTQARALCTAMKNAGITVYTVGFELGGSIQ